MDPKHTDKADAKSDAPVRPPKDRALPKAAPGETATLELGATLALSAAEAIADPNNDIETGRPALWSTTGNAVILATEDRTGDTMNVVGSSIGKSRVSYAQKVDISADDAMAAAFAGAKYTDEVHSRHAVYWDIEVIPVGGAATQAAQAAAAAGSSLKFDGLLPMTEPQEGPSEKTPYGMDQENKPVAPFPGMVNPNDDSSVARQSEDAVAKGSPEGIAKAKEEAKDEAAAKSKQDEKDEKDEKKHEADEKKHEASLHKK
jgi:hypothetical protein